MVDDAGRSNASSPTVQPGTTIAVTGATGFIGGRLVERLAEQGAIVTCFVRGSAIGSRLQDTGAIIRMLDIAQAEPLTDALAGAEFVFHCAYDWDNTAWNYAGLHALIEACRTNGCRLVHLSSFVVYQLPVVGEVTEFSAPSTSGIGYSHTKRELEDDLLRAAAAREDPLAVAILQPTIVYGPFSRPFAIEPADALLRGSVVLPDRGEGICNAVYVDDVVDAMILAALHPESAGKRFLISGPPITWSHFYEEIAKAADAPSPHYRPIEALEREVGTSRKILRLLSDPQRMIARISRVGPVNKAMNVMAGVLPSGVWQRTTHRLTARATRRGKGADAPDLGRIRFLQSRATISSGRARAELGYEPRFDFAAGMVPTTRYLRERLRKLQ